MNNPETINRRSDREIFFEALDKSTPAERAAFLDGACGKDPVKRRRVEELLANHFQQDSFMKASAADGPPTVLSSTPLTEGPGTVIGRYKLLEKVGEGGFGVVYAAEQREPVKRRLALKIIKLGMDTKQVVARFEAERQALALMDHPNIAKVIDAGATDTGRPYFVMELVRGIKITDYCDQNHLPTAERLNLFIQVCHAIQHAHQKGVIHRDIKPSNILVTLHDGRPVPKVIDFGIAKATQQELTEKTLYTQLQQFIGTPAYMSPEQAEMSGLDIDTRSDIYSLGVLLYELLTGKTPFDGKELLQSGLDAMRRTIREKEPLRPSTRLTMELTGSNHKSSILNHKSELPAELDSRRMLQIREMISHLRGDLDWIVMKCLEKDRTHRYETANGLVNDIEHHLNNEPVEARPPSQLYRFRKLVRRNKTAFAAAAGIGIALLVGSVVSTWQAVRATRAEREQIHLRQQAEANEQKAQQAQASEAEQRQHAEAQELIARQRAYASDMNLAQQALAVNNLGKAWDLLNRHRPSGESQISNLKSQIQTDLRGWEWRYLWQQCQSDALFTLCQRSSWIWSLAVSHDGRWGAVGEHANNTLSIWDLRTRQQIASLPAGEGYVRVAFSPKEPLLAFAFATNYTNWRLTNGEYRVRLWNGATKQPVAELPLGSICNGLAFSDDGHRLITSTAGLGSRLTVWRVPEGTELTSYEASGSPAVTAFAVTRDLSLAAHRITGPMPGQQSLRVLDLTTGEERWHAPATDEASLGALAFSPDAKVLASAPYSGESDIRLWDVASGNMIRRLEGHGNGVEALVFWPDGKTLASACRDQTIRLWDVPSGRQKGPPLRGHRRPVMRLALAPDSTTLVSGSKDGSVFLWDTTAIRRDPGPAILTNLHAWGFDADNKSVVTVDRQGRVARRQGADFQEAQPLLEFSANIFGACFSGDGRWAAVGSSNGIVQIADLQRPGVVGEFQAHAGRVLPLQFLSQGKKLAVIHVEDRSLHEWDLTTSKKTRTFQRASHRLGYPGNWNRLPAAFSPDERGCLTLGWMGESLLTDLATGRPSYPNLDISQARCAAYSPDGKLFAAGSESGFAKLWETDTWREVTRLSGVAEGVSSVAFWQDGKRLVTGSDENEAIKLWDLESKQEVLTLEGQGLGFWSTAFSADGNVFGSMNDRGVLHLWRAPSWAEIEAAEKAQAK